MIIDRPGLNDVQLVPEITAFASDVQRSHCDWTMTETVVFLFVLKAFSWRINVIRN